MRLLLFSDIHANLEAMEACLAVVPAYDVLVNLGDVVGYNASPNEVCEKVRAMGGTIVRGNHDRACCGLTDLGEFNLVAAMSAKWTQTALSSENLEWLRTLPRGPMRDAKLDSLEFVHGSPRDEDEYLLNPSTAAANLRMPGHGDKIFFGHTHLQGGFALQDGRVRNFSPIFPTGEDVVEFTMPLARNERYLINPGSIGQPRDGDWRAAFALYERDGDAAGVMTFYRVPYDVEETQQRIIAANLPERLATRLKLGR